MSTTTNDPTWLVQTADGALYTYYTLTALLIDLRANQLEPVKLFRRTCDLGRTHYIPCTQQQLELSLPTTPATHEGASP